MGDHKGQEAKEFELDCISAGKQLNALGGKECIGFELGFKKINLIWWVSCKAWTRETTASLEMKDASKVIEYRINSTLLFIRCGAQRREWRENVSNILIYGGGEDDDVINRNND